MTSFCIDDVRETMPREVIAFLSKIEDSARDFVAAEGIAQQAALLNSVRHAGHAIYGTSSLVSATTLAACADIIERLAERGHTELAEAEARVARARRTVALIPTGIEQMRAVLELELVHERDEADWLAAEWLGTAATLLSELERSRPGVASDPARHSLHAMLADDDALTEVPKAAARRDSEAELIADDEIEFVDDEISVGAAPVATATNGAVPKLPALEFSFEDLEEPGKAPSPQAQPGRKAQLDSDSEDFSFAVEGEDRESPSATYADVERELLAIFQLEAREAVVALQGHLDALVESPSDRSAAAPIERIYHTLKGAAATVGLADVSAHAAALQQRAEDIVGGSGAVERSLLESLVADTNDLFAQAGLAEISVVARAAVARPHGVVSSSSELRRQFLAEARDIYEQASSIVAELASPAGEKLGRPLLANLVPLVHRLKGSAALVGEPAVAEIAAELEAACRAPEAPGTATLSRGLSRIAAKLGLLQEPAQKAPQQDSTSSALTRAAFEREAKQLLEGALRLTGDLGGSSESRVVAAQRELSRLFHHLRGSAGIVGDQGVVAEASELEVLVQGRSALETSAQLINERLSALHARFAPGSSRLEDEKRTPRAANRRERVEITAADELWQTFSAECGELMDTIERSCLSLEESTTPKDQLRSLMRAFHTLKGVVNTLAIGPTGRTLHRVEDLLEQLLETQILPPVRGIASLLIDVQVEVKRNLKEARTGWVETNPERLEQRIAALLNDRQDPTRSALSHRSEELSATPSSQHSAASMSGDGPDRRVIRVATQRLDSLMNLAGELVVSRSRLGNRVERLRSLQSELMRGSKRLLQTVEAFREEHEFENLDGKKQRLRLVASGGEMLASGAEMLAAANETAHAPVWSGFSELELDRYEGIHVLTRSLTELTSDFSDLHSQLSRGLMALTDDSDVVGSIVSGIQNEITQARMVPLEALFLRLRLPLRDAAQRERKEVRVVVRGEQVPVDKTIADALFQPLLHLVRNAVVHGIESAERRLAANKPRAGTIELTARQESGQIVIEVRDDGAGLDLTRLRARGIQMGLLPQDVELADMSVRDMVFARGLSTHAGADDVAGRGVGGEVVKRAVDRLNGSIRVETNAGRGTAFVIRLPLTLAITRALVVRAAEQIFALPLHFAERIIDAHEQDIVNQGDLRRIKLDGTYLPIRSLEEFFGSEAESKEGPVLILRVGDSRLALQVEQIVAHEEIVVKGLGALLSGHPTFSGITIRGTGQLVFIIDVPSLLDSKGSTLVREPRRSRDAENGAAEAKAPIALGAATASSARAVRVLFVDDSVSVRKVAEMQLKELGAEVTLAVDGMDAMAKLRERPVDIVFTDLEMPRMHGYELIRELRFLPAYKDLPIVVVTSRSGQKHQDQARQLGASEYLTKPFTPQMLEAALAKWRPADRTTSASAHSASERSS